MGKTVAILQSNYIPWRGYFHLIDKADAFILLDCVQYTRQNWRNRNRVKTSQGMQWLTIPVRINGLYHQAIDETRVSNSHWVEKHIRTITASYGRAFAFTEEAPWLFARMREAAHCDYLSPINVHLLRALCDRLGIATPMINCDTLLRREDLVEMDANSRLLALLQATGASSYLSGPAARAYLDKEALERAGIELEWADYTDFPAYPQLWGDFTNEASVVDLLLNVGATSAQRYLTPAPWPQA